MSFEICPDFITVECQEFCQRVADGTHDSPKETQSGKRLVTSKNVKNGRLDIDSAYRISHEDFEAINKRSKVDQWDILLTMIGTVGELCVVKEASPDFAIKNVGLLKCGDEIRAKWLYYFLRSPQGQSLIEQRKKGSTQQYISLTEIRKLPIPYPTEAGEMKRIVHILSALDDRISLLRETNATLEAIAQALFKSWFVEFDPVRAKMEGRTPEGMDEATAALFPYSFEETELGVVPRGWGITRLDSLLELAYGKALKAEARKPGGVPVYGSGGITGWHDTALVNEPSVIVGRKGTVGSIYWESRPFFPIDTVFYVKTKHPLTYCHQLLKTLGLHEMNTDAAVPGLNRENVYRLLVSDAPPAVLASFDVTACVLRQRIDENEKQAQTLSTLRDTLLPRLISGQVRLPETKALSDTMTHTVCAHEEHAHAHLERLNAN